MKLIIDQQTLEKTNAEGIRRVEQTSSKIFIFMRIRLPGAMRQGTTEYWNNIRTTISYSVMTPVKYWIKLNWICFPPCNAIWSTVSKQNAECWTDQALKFYVKKQNYSTFCDSTWILIKSSNDSYMARSRFRRRTSMWYSPTAAFLYHTSQKWRPVIPIWIRFKKLVRP